MQQHYNRAAQGASMPSVPMAPGAVPGPIGSCCPAPVRAQVPGPTPSDGRASPAAAVPTSPRRRRGPSLATIHQFFWG